MPKTATDEMYLAGAELDGSEYVSVRKVYKAMLAAAPQPPEVDSMATASVSPWLPIESAPKDGSNFYVTGFNYGNASNGRWHDVGHVTPRGGIKSTLTWLSLDFATHWMPLPVFDGGQ